MGETLAEAPLVDLAPPAPGGIILDSVDWDYSHLKPSPAFMAETPAEVSAAEAPATETAVAIGPVEAPPPVVEPIYSPAEGWQLAQNAEGKTYVWREAPGTAFGRETFWIKPGQWEDEKSQEPTESEPKAPEDSKESEVILKDAAGNQWRYAGQTELSGEHKVETPDGNHTKMLDQARFQELFPPATVEKQPEPESQLLGDPEIAEMKNQVVALTEEVARLKSEIEKIKNPNNASPETGRIFSWITGTYEPVQVISRGSRNGENFVTVLREGRDQPTTVFADEYEYWQEQALKFEQAPQNQEQARQRFSEGFKSVRSKLAESSAKAKNALSETIAPHLQTAKEVLQPMTDELRAKAEYVAGSAKEAVGVGIATGQVWAEKAGGAGQTAAKTAAGAAKEVVVYPWLTGQVLSENIHENLPAKRKRLIGRAAGYAAVFSVWIFGPARVEAQPLDAAQAGTGTDKIDAPAAII